MIPRRLSELSFPSPQSDTSPELVTVTPELAKQWLTRNTRNRPVNRVDVERLARAIGNGEWVVNGHTVTFDVDGVLVDGQHRLLAAVRANCPIQTYVVYGLSKEAQDTVDVGRKRSAADMLALRGYKNARTLAAAVQLCLLHTRSGGGYDFNHVRAYTNSEIEQFLRTDLYIETALQATKDMKRIRLMEPSLAAFLWWRLSQIHIEDCEEFFTGLIHGQNLENYSPVLALRNRLIALRADPHHHRGVPRYNTVGLTMRAWNAYRSDQQIKSLRFVAAEPIPRPI